MLVAALATLILVAGPDEEISPAAKKLRVAWASQYEWREDGIRNVTIDFSWTRKTKTRRDQYERTGSGQVVVVGNEIKRIHVTGRGADKEIRDAVRWVIDRYARKPFEEAFKDIELKLLEKSPLVGDKVQAKNRVFVLKNDRIIAIERPIGGRQRGNIRVDYKLADMGDGYGRVRELFSIKREGEKETTTRSLEQRDGSDVPMPGRFHQREERKDKVVVMLELTFGEPKTNQKDAIVVDAEARDILRDAWKQRYVLPKGSRLVAEFTRKPGKVLGKMGWNNVDGEFELNEEGKVEVILSDKIRSRRFRDAIRVTCEQHLMYLFGLFKDIEFDKEFKDCGFARQDSELGMIIRVYGYEDAVAFLVKDYKIIGYLDKDARAEEWYTFSLKNAKDGRVMIDRITRVYEGSSKTARISYTRAKGGVSVPRKFQYITLPGLPLHDFDVCTYQFKRIKYDGPR